VKGLCESCGANADDFCQAGMTCGSSDGATVQCVKYCCVDADCGGSPCQTGVFLFAPGVGVCANGGAGGGGQGGAGGGGGAGGAGGS
jgi:hypothetical protein